MSKDDQDDWGKSVVNVKNCPRCGATHLMDVVRFERATQIISRGVLVAVATHWGLCQVTGEPVQVIVDTPTEDSDKGLGPIVLSTRFNIEVGTAQKLFAVSEATGKSTGEILAEAVDKAYDKHVGAKEGADVQEEV